MGASAEKGECRSNRLVATNVLATLLIAIGLLFLIGCSEGAWDIDGVQPDNTPREEATEAPATESLQTGVLDTPEPTINPTAAATAPGVPTGRPTLADPQPTPQAEQSGTFNSLLSLIPATPDSRKFVVINDYVLARDSHSVPHPDADSTDEELLEFIKWTNFIGMSNGPWISGFTTPYAVEQLKNSKHLGFDVRHVETSIAAGPPPVPFEAVTGRFDPDATQRALNQCSECEEATLEEHLGVPFFVWGEDSDLDLHKRFQPPAYDQLGGASRVAVMDSFVFRTLETEAMKSLINSHQGRTDSLTDDQDLALAARLMDAMNHYSGVLMGEVDFQASISPPCGDWCTQKQYDAWLPFAEKAIDKYDALGTGVGTDSDGLFFGLVFVYGDEADAERNVRTYEDWLATMADASDAEWNDGARISVAWSEVFLTAQVWHEGRALVAKLRPTDGAHLWSISLFGPETPQLLHK